MDLTFLEELFLPVVAGICLCAGYALRAASLIPKRWIPLFNAALGTLLAVWMEWGSITPAVVLGGMFSGLASTGMHEALKNLLEPERN